MKFAVLEYHSKTGKIWRHRPERPNYVCDPITEIDPTSFGCYVSALSGEHIPLTSLVLGPTNPVNAFTAVYRKVYKRLLHNWPKYNTDYLNNFDIILAVHQLSDAHEIVALLKQLRKKSQRPYIIGVPTQPYGILREHLEKDPQAFETFKEFMAHVDVFATLSQATNEYYENISKTPVIYLPQPYPVEFAHEHWRTRTEKEPYIFVAGVTQRDNIRQGQTVAKKLQEKFPELNIRVPHVAGMTYDTTNLTDTNYTVQPFEKWQDHLVTLSKATLVINTDYTFTRGRVQTDCAAVGTPSIGANSDAQRDLFPTLYEPTEQSTDLLVSQGEKLISDARHYEAITNFAYEKLKEYSYDKCAQRLVDIPQTYPQRIT